ncbi:divergent polysaccharide deacetylase family protein [Brevibacillus sp. H7]|uniref:divergent polysaccharide deacetylase family protein n=1 Tax=Brevibacillus sp. H7 TaxID=3349138 RepID=UPI00382AE14A
MCKAKAVFSFLLALVLSVQSASTLTAANEQALKKRVAFVIDDFGNNMPGTLEMLNMPVPLTVAVMPFLPSTKRDAEIAHRNHHEVFVDLPMEPVKGKRSWLGPGAITTDLRSEEVRVGPPGKKTASVLRRYIPRIQKEARFVTISKLLMEETP